MYNIKDPQRSKTKTPFPSLRKMARDKVKLIAREWPLINSQGTGAKERRRKEASLRRGRSQVYLTSSRSYIRLRDTLAEK